MPNFLTGTPSRFEKISRFKPGQEAGFEQMLSQGLSGLAGGAPSFEPIRERAMKTYQQDIVPSLAERFTGMGAQRSSGFQEGLSRGGTDLASTLAGMESQFGQQQFGNLMQMLGVGLTPQDEIGYFGGTQGMLGGMSPGIGSGIGSLLAPIGAGIGSMFGGPAGGAAGGAAGGGANALINLILSYLGGGGQGGQGAQSGSVSMTPSQNPILGSNII